MEEKPNYVKRTQKDYSLTLKIQIVKEVESGALSTLSAQRKYGIQSRSTVVTWLRKYGNFDWEKQTPSNMPKSPEQRILELEAKVKLLEKQKAQLERQNYVADQKAVIFDMMIDIA
ncbi:transposase [Elizabethkingia anophelis]|uniref:transposase n=1 Tax=Elizabethkingia anophelis TaxID=1117645 RepID=UPI0038918ECD